MPGAVRVVDRIIDQADFQQLGALAAGDVLRYSGSRWRNYAGTGATLPTSPVTGQYFLHTPTGRTNLMVYDGSVWRPILSIGTWTVYVDTTNGTDDQNLGFGTGTDAFKTIQFAVDQIAGLYAGNILISVAAGTYAETVVVRGKNPTGNFTITIRGSQTVHETIICTGGTQGATSSYGTVEYGSWGSHVGKFLRGKSGANDGVIRIIDAISGTTATIVAYWAGTVSSGHEFEVCTPAVTVTGINLGQAQQNVIIEHIEFGYSNATHTVADFGAYTRWNFCRQFFSTGGTLQVSRSAVFDVDTCIFERCRLYAMAQSALTIRGIRVWRGHTSLSTARMVHCYIGATAHFISRPTVLDGDNYGLTGVMCQYDSSMEMSTWYHTIRNCKGGGTGRGIRVETTSAIQASANTMFPSGSNDTDVSADATTFGVYV